MITFTVSDSDQKKIKAWSKKQTKGCFRSKGDAGIEPLEYVFQLSGVGEVFFVRNTLNGEVLNLTDYEKW